MKKWKKVVIILLCIVVFLGAAGYIAYNIAFDFVQDKMIETMLDSMLDSGDVSVEELELMAEVTLPEEPEEPSESITSDVPESSVPAASESTAPAEKEKTKTESKPSQKQPSKPQVKPEQKTETKTENKPTEEKRTEAVDKMTQKISDSITRADKRAMARLVTSHLSAADIKYLAGLIAGGLTREERSAAYRLAKQRFSGEELELVSMYYHRYKKQIMIEPDYPTK